MSATDSTQILDEQAINRIIKRLAMQLLENNFQIGRLVLAGVEDKGTRLAQRVADALKAISTLQTEIVTIRIDKDNPLTGPARLEATATLDSYTHVIICDDVLYTGKTLAYGMLPFLQAGVESIQCLCLVARNHQTFPIHVKYVGLHLSTTLQEHVQVTLKDKLSVVLN